MPSLGTWPQRPSRAGSKSGDLDRRAAGRSVHPPGSMTPGQQGVKVQKTKIIFLGTWGAAAGGAPLKGAPTATRLPGYLGRSLHDATTPLPDRWKRQSGILERKQRLAVSCILDYTRCIFRH
jgi:hypothetical protein